jgi:hypothetical protein|tara:strand:+ start:2368 stop:3024 length:657 start_codon:yes stop_codon:yes gene_type:complete
MTLPNKFRNESEGVIASYNYTDIADGTGIVTFYAGIGETSAGNIYILSQQTQRMSILYEAASVAGSASEYTKGYDKDFDLTPFNAPRIIGGTVTAGLGWSQWERSGSLSATGYVRLVIKHVTEAGAETDLVTLQTPTATGGDAQIHIVDYVSGTIPRTHFKIGEKLRVTYEGWWFQDNGTPQPWITNEFYFDPLNAVNGDQGAGDTQFFINIPFDLDL